MLSGLTIRGIIKMELVKWNAAKHAIVEAKSIDEVKEIKDKAEAMRAYSKQIGESLETQNDICEIKLRAERRMGEMLKEMPKRDGNPANKMLVGLKKNKNDNRENTLPVTHIESSRYQKIAELPEETFENIVEETKEAGKELTEALMLNTAKKIDRQIKIQNLKEGIEKGDIKLPEGKFQVIVIDPPWGYDDTYNPEKRRGTIPYPSMALEELKEIDLPAADDSILFLWTTQSRIWDTKELLEAWGYEYRAILTWDKELMGIGLFFRMQCEFCIVGIKGKPIWNATDVRDIIRETRTTHSTKPEAFYQMIDKHCVGRKLDYFARKQRKGWEVYGNEV